MNIASFLFDISIFIYKFKKDLIKKYRNSAKSIYRFATYHCCNIISIPTEKEDKNNMGSTNIHYDIVYFVEPMLKKLHLAGYLAIQIDRIISLPI